MENQKKTRVYIAGKVSGLNMSDVRKKFLHRQRELEAEGFIVINPVERILNVNLAKVQMGEPPLTEDENRKEILGICLYDLSQCDELHLLHDWEVSPGALLEVSFAERLGMKIVP